uniref:Neurocalcin homolog n=1 Tax=Mesocestoides corti TaxID=53468 RepID=A0A5K3FML4_MESCO
MGAKQAKLKSEVLDELTRSTPFNEEEIHRWYHGFVKDCPSGQLTVDDFQRIYSALFSNPNALASNGDCYGDPGPFAGLVFRAFDQNGDGVVEFRDIITTLNIIGTGNDEEQRLRWAFHVYDLDGDGYISRGEMLHVVKAIYKMIGPTVISRVMPADESTPEQRTHRLFALMDRDGDDRISLDDFMEGVYADPEVLAFLQAPTTTSASCASASDVQTCQHHHPHSAVDNGQVSTR